MKVLAIGLFLSLILAIAFGRTFVDLGLQTEEEEREAETRDPESFKTYYKRQTVAYENGGVSDIYYNITLKKNLYILEKMVVNIDRFECTLDSLTITVNDKRNAKNWREGTIIVGDDMWGCLNAQGEVDVFYRVVNEIEWITENTVVMETSSLQFHELFHGGNLKFRMDPEAVNHMPTTKRINWSVQRTYGINNNPVQPFRIFGIGKQTTNRFGSTSFSFEVMCTRCFAQLNAGIEFQLEVGTKWLIIPVLKLFKLRVFGGYEAALEIDATANFASNYAWERDVLNKDLVAFRGRIFGISFTIGVGVGLKASAYLNAQATGTFSLKLGTRRFWEAGIVYTEQSKRFEQIVPQNIKENNFAPKPVITYSGTLDARVTLKPQLRLNLFGVPISGSLEPYLGLEANFGQGSCTPNYIPFYNLYAGIDWEFSIGAVKIDLLITKIQLSSPYTRRGTLISKVSLLTGCLFVKKSSTQGQPTSQGSVTCPGGNVGTDGFGGGRCFPNGTVASAELEGYCNLVPCAVPCDTYSSCGQCLLDPRCEWCGDSPSGAFCYEPNQNETLLDTENGTIGYLGACSPDKVFASQCTNETRFSDVAITPPSPVSGPSDSVSNVTVSWNGGEVQTSVEVYLNVNGKWILIASGKKPLPPFALPPALPSRNDYRIRLFSLDDPTNTVDNANFTISALNDCESGAISCTAWIASDWQECDADCGGGMQTRTVQCISSKEGIIDNSNCSGTPPTSSRSCNTQNCFDYFVAITNPVTGAIIPINTATNITWSGGQKGSTVAISFRATANGAWVNIAAAAPNTGVYIWNLGTYPTSSTYQIRVVSGANATNFDVSKPFVISAPKAYTLSVEAAQAFSSSVVVTATGTYGDLSHTFNGLNAGKNTVQKTVFNLGTVRLFSATPSTGQVKVTSATVSYPSDDGSTTITALFGPTTVSAGENTTFIPDCTSFESCYDCLTLGASSCGWCESTLACLPGNTEGTVLNGICPQWLFNLPNANDTCTGRIFTPTGNLVNKPQDTSSSHQILFAPLFAFFLALVALI